MGIYIIYMMAIVKLFEDVVNYYFILLTNCDKFFGLQVLISVHGQALQ